MKARLLLLLTLAGFAIVVSGCSTSAHVGTRNHGVGVSGSVR